MISRLFGPVVDMDDNGRIVIDCRGVGYDVVVHDRDRLTLNARRGTEQLVFVRTVVKEPPEGVVLFGFVDVDDRRMFDRIVAVDGCGPVIAMKLLSRYAGYDLVAAVTDVNSALGVPGIGPKTRAKLADAWS